MTSNLPSENDLNHEKPSIELFCESFSEDVVSTNAKNMMKIEESATQVISGDTQAMNADVHHHPQKMQPSKPDSPQAGKSSTSTGSRKVTSSDSKLNLSNSGKSNKQQEEEHLTFPFVDESFPEVPNSKSMKEKNNAVAIEACKNHFKLAYSQLKSALIDQMEQASSNINIINHLLHGELTTTDAQTLRFERDRLYLDREHFLKQLATGIFH